GLYNLPISFVSSILYLRIFICFCSFSCLLSYFLPFTSDLKLCHVPFRSYFLSSFYLLSSIVMSISFFSFIYTIFIASFFHLVYFLPLFFYFRSLFFCFCFCFLLFS